MVGFIHSTKRGPFVAIDDLQPMPVALPSESKAVGPTPEEPEIQELARFHLRPARVFTAETRRSQR